MLPINIFVLSAFPVRNACSTSQMWNSASDFWASHTTDSGPMSCKHWNGFTIVFRPLVIHHSYWIGHLYSVRPSKHRVQTLFEKWWKSPWITPFRLPLRTLRNVPSREVAVHMSICFAHHQAFSADRAQHAVDPAALGPREIDKQDR